MGVTRAFVTGIGGQDGGYLAERLVAEGTEVHALALPSDGPPRWCPPEVVLHPGDVTDVAAVRSLVVDLRPDELYNLAGVSSVARSWSEPELTAQVNGLAAAALLESAWRCQERHGREVRFVQASSAEIFGLPARSPQDESTPLAPVSPYGAAKAFAHLSVGVQRARGLHASSLVLYNHESPRRGPEFVTGRIARGVAAIAAGRAATLTLGDLAVRRDWGWAPDYVDAMVRAARADRPGDYVVATGESHSVRDFAEAAFAVAGIDDWEDLVRSDPSLVRPADARELVGDASRARDALGWEPTRGFAEVVEAMVAEHLRGDDA